MAIKVRIPSPLRSYTNGVDVVETDGTSAPRARSSGGYRHRCRHRSSRPLHLRAPRRDMGAKWAVRPTPGALDGAARPLPSSSGRDDAWSIAPPPKQRPTTKGHGHEDQVYQGTDHHEGSHRYGGFHAPVSRDGLHSPVVQQRSVRGAQCGRVHRPSELSAHCLRLAGAGLPDHRRGDVHPQAAQASVPRPAGPLISLNPVTPADVRLAAASKRRK